MHIHLIQVPYDSGWRGVRMGRGPSHLIANGAVERLGAGGRAVRTAVVESDTYPEAVRTGFDLCGGLARQVRTAMEGGALPLVLAGNCLSAVGTTAGLSGDRDDLGIVWLDGHADFNTPEITDTGFLDGMAMATAAGRCWRTLAGTVPGFRPVGDERIVLVGARDIDPLEQQALDASGVVHLRPEPMRAEGVAAILAPALDDLAKRVSAVYLHIDLDVHDPALAPANQYRPPGGLTPAEVREAVRLTALRIPVAAAALTAFDPTCDVAGTTLAAGLDLLDQIAGLATVG